MIKHLLFAATLGVFVFQASGVFAVNVGDGITFNVDQNFQKNEQAQVQAVLVKTSPNLYFYVEKNWWDSQIGARQQEILQNLDTLSAEFSNNIYPTLTSIYGPEWRPGVDGDSKITILFHAMKDNVGGYFRSSDEYVKLQIPDSNEREMVYLPLAQIDNAYKLKVFLAHEFTHLIQFNQKDRLLGVAEDVWLNEARAEYAVSLLGYNDSYEGSNLQARVKDFLEKPTDSLAEWKGAKYDYGVINLFMHYLVDHYGVNVLSDSLKLKSVGIASINEILSKSGYQEDFSDIFTDWTIALAVNDCTVDLKYCYLNKNLASFKVSPALIFLPLSGDSSLSLTNVTKNWSGNWQKIIGGEGDITLKFSSLVGLNFKVPYIVVKQNGSYTIQFLSLNEKQEGQISLEDFGTVYSSLILMPSLQTKLTQFGEFELTYPYTFTISVAAPPSVEEQTLIDSLLAQIEVLKKQIADILASRNPPVLGCSSLNTNLYIGIINSAQVTCLQAFLKSQGTTIYPEGLVTGTFGSLTKAAATRFQAKYGIPTTGYVGILTRAKINSLLSQ